MTDYNDGNWHAWEPVDGAECPVHGESRVAVSTPRWMSGPDVPARTVDWTQPLLFRVLKPYVEPRKPREWWINEYGDRRIHTLHDTEREAHMHAFSATLNAMRDLKRIACIHVREVLE